MQAALPMRSTDDDGGKLMAATYARMLGHHSREALLFMAEQAVAMCKWFPTIAECGEIIGTWRRTDDAVEAKRIATAMVATIARQRRETAQEAQATALTAIRNGRMSQAEFDALPETTRGAAEALGYARRNGDTLTVKVAA